MCPKLSVMSMIKIFSQFANMCKIYLFNSHCNFAEVRNIYYHVKALCIWHEVWNTNGMRYIFWNVDHANLILHRNYFHNETIVKYPN